MITKTIGVVTPLDLLDNIKQDLADSEIGTLLSDLVPGFPPDYFRAGALLLNLLLRDPRNRARVLALLRLPDYRLEEVVTQIAFKAAVLPNVSIYDQNDRDSQGRERLKADPPGALESDPIEHERIYRQNEGLETAPGEAPMEDATPWDNI